MMINRVFAKGFMIVILTYVLAMISLMTNEPVAYSQAMPLAIFTASQQSHRIYLPILIESVTEVGIPPCRWPHTIGTYTGI